MKQLFIASLLVLAATPLLAAQPSAACAANQAHCTDALLAAERESDIKKATKKVAQQEQKLAKAEDKGDSRKIATQQAKLDEARSELAQAQKPLLP